VKARKNSVDQAKDAGLAVVLTLLLLSYFRQQHNLIVPAIGVLILTMMWPAAFGPLARVWFGLSYLLSNIVSKVFLTIIFIAVVTPVGLIRRICGADSMTLRRWKKGQDSTFLKRERLFSAKDLENPY
jgi:hypothetical protein